MKRFRHFTSLILLILLAWLSFYSLMPSEPTSSDVPLDQFSTQRAFEKLKVISKEPHYIGSDGHTEVRNYIITQLQAMGLETQVQDDFTLSQRDLTGHLVRAKNVVARIKGTNSSKSVLVMSHYDSAPHSKSHGASDAGSGVVTVLESVRAFLASGKKAKNDIILLFTDAEEIGLHGASLFVNEHPWAKDVGVALNFEARGSGGPSNMIIETNGGNKELIKAFAAANPEYPVATSLMYSIYKMLPNDTDSTVLREQGDIDGYFFAFIDDHFDYHTANDTWQRLDPETLEHQGSYLLPLLTYFAQLDRIDVKSAEDYVYFDTAVFDFISYPFSWIWPMVIGAFLIFVLLVIKGFRTKRVSLKSVGRGFIAFILSILASLFVLQVFGWLWPLVYPQYGDMLPVFIYNGHRYTIAFVVMTLAMCFGVYSHLVKAQDTPSMMIAPLTFWLVITIAVAIKLQGAAYFIIPIYFALLAFYITLTKTRPSVLLLVLLSAPALFLFVPLLQFFPVGLGPAAYWITILFTGLLFGLLLPVFGYYRNKRLLGYLGIFLTFILVVFAHRTSEYSNDRNKPNSLVYYHNANENKAYWLTYDKRLDPWVEGYVTKDPMAAEALGDLSSASKYWKKYTYGKETSVIPLAQSAIYKEERIDSSGLREVTLVIKPNRRINLIELRAPKEIPFSKLVYNGKEVYLDSVSIGKERPTAALLSYYLSPEDSLSFTYRTADNSDPILTLKETSLDLLENELFTVAQRPESTMAAPFIVNDAIVVERTIDVARYAFAKAETQSPVEGNELHQTID